MTDTILLKEQYLESQEYNIAIDDEVKKEWGLQGLNEKYKVDLISGFLRHMRNAVAHNHIEVTTRNGEIIYTFFDARGKNKDVEVKNMEIEFTPKNMEVFLKKWASHIVEKRRILLYRK